MWTMNSSLLLLVPNAVLGHVNTNSLAKSGAEGPQHREITTHEQVLVLIFFFFGF